MTAAATDLPVAGSPSRIDELLGRRVSMRAFALLRIMAGPIVLLHLWPFLADVIDGRIYRDAFYEPYASWYPELPREVYVVLLWTGAAAAVAMTLGFLTKAATVITFAVVTYNLFLSTTHYHNNRAYLVIVLGALRDHPVRARALGGPMVAVPPWTTTARSDRPGLAALAPPPRSGDRLRCVRAEQARRRGLVRWDGDVATGRAGAGSARHLTAARLGDHGADEPLVPHLRRQGHRGHGAVHRLRALVAVHPLRGGVDRRLLPHRHPALGVGRGLLLPRHRRARHLGRAVDAGSAARRRPCVGVAPTGSSAASGHSTGWPASASNMVRPDRRCESPIATARSSTVARRSPSC